MHYLKCCLRFCLAYGILSSSIISAMRSGDHYVVKDSGALVRSSCHTFSRLCSSWTSFPYSLENVSIPAALTNELRAFRYYKQADISCRGCFDYAIRVRELSTLARSEGEVMLSRRFALIAGLQLKRASIAEGQCDTPDYKHKLCQLPVTRCKAF